MLTALGVAAALTMVVAYALESRGHRWIAIFAVGCFAASGYAVATSSWIFAALELAWGVIAIARWRSATAGDER